MNEIKIEKKGGSVYGLEQIADAMQSVRNGEYIVTIRRNTERRTISQNALMWMWFACIEDETGTPPVDIHDFYCKKFLSRSVRYDTREETVYCGTSRLSKEEFTNFLNNVQADAASELGIKLPTPEDRAFERFFEQYGSVREWNK